MGGIVKGKREPNGQAMIDLEEEKGSKHFKVKLRQNRNVRIAWSLHCE